MTHSIATAMTAAQAADIVRTSNNPREIEEAWETAVELFKAGVQDEDIAIALTGWTLNRSTPASVIEDFWKDQDIRLLADGVWGEILVEIMALPETPDSIMEEIMEDFDILYRHFQPLIFI